MKRMRSITVLAIAMILSLALLVNVSAAGETIRGDMDSSGTVNEEDVLYLLRHTLFPDRYPLNQSGDMDRDGAVNANDPIYLLWHTLMPDKYPLECTVHTAVVLPAVEAACGSSGLTEGSACGVCGEILTTQEYIAPLGHTVTGSTTVEATCTEAGYVQSQCSVCGEYVAREILYATGHSFGEYTTVRAASCNQGGTQERTCGTCGEKETAETGALGHSYALTEQGSYVCGTCGDTVRRDADECVSTEGEYITDCPVDYGFSITTDGDEAYIRENLVILDVTYDGTSQEAEGIHDYILTQQPDGTWVVTPTPAYEENTTYIARLEGDLKFTDHMGDTLTFRIVGENGAVYQFSEKLIFIKLPEVGDPRRDAYKLDMPEDADLIYLTLPERGIFTEEYVGRVICVGDYESMEQLQEDPSGEAAFGKIAQVMLQADGSCLLVLECPKLEEVYDDLDVIYSGPVEMLDPETIKEAEQQAVDAVYASEGFADFLASAMIASESYAEEHGLVVDGAVSGTVSLLDNLKLTVKSSYKDEKLTVGVTATLSVPLKNSDGEEYGTLKFSLETSLEYRLKVNAECRLWKIKDLVLGVRSFKFEINSESTFKFAFEVALEMEKTWGGGDSTIYRSSQGMLHRSGCSVLDQDTRKVEQTPSDVDLRYRGVLGKEKLIECPICKPISDYMDNNYFFVNKDSGTTHRFCCDALDRWTVNGTAGYVTQELPGTYSFCLVCDPQGRQNVPLNFESYLKAAMKYKNWLDVRQETKEHLEKQNLGNQKNNNIGVVDLPVYFSIFEVHLDVDIVMEIKFEGTLNYEYVHTSNDTFGIRMDSDCKIVPYKHNNSSGNTNTLALMGKASAKLGLKVSARATLAGWDRFVNIGIYGETGMYAEVTGVMRLGTEQIAGEWQNFCYGTAYMECGIYTDISFQYKVVFLNGKLSLLGGEKRLPILAVGYDRVYYNYAEVPELIEVTGNSVDLSPYDVLNSLYYSARKDDTGKEILNIAGVPGKYDVSIELLDENGETPAYATANGGVITMTEDAPCDTVLTVIVSVEGKEKMVSTVGDFLKNDFKTGSCRYDLPNYMFKLHIEDHAIGDWETLVEPTCTEEGVKVRYYTCDCVDEEGNPKEYERGTIPALGHAEVTDEAVKMTCTQDGWTAGSHCERCGLVFVEQILIPARGHSYTDVFTCHDRPCQYADCDHVELATTEHRWTEWLEMEAGGCGGVSFRIHACVDCGYTEDEEGSQGAVTHCDLLPEEHTPPTCKTDGYYRAKCKKCGRTVEIVLDKTGHDMSQEYFSDADTHYKKCLNPNCIEKTEEDGHEYDYICDEDCNVCGRTRPVEHTWREGYQTDAACHWRICVYCDAIGHKSIHRGGTPACETKAECKDCGVLYGEAGKHDFSVESLNFPKDEVTCTKPATYYYACSHCGVSSQTGGNGENFSYGDPLGHNVSEDFLPVAGKDKHNKPCQNPECYYAEEEEDCYGGTATCEAQAVCEVCHDPYGTKGHEFTVESMNFPKDDADCTKAATYYYACVFCGVSSHVDGNGENFSYGEPLGHNVSEDFVPIAGKDKHNKPCQNPGCNEAIEEGDCYGGMATCEAQAVCEVCHDPYGTKGHEFTVESLNFPKDAATCTKAATYYYACVFCGVSSGKEGKGENFPYGDPLGHNWETSWTPGTTQHWHKCDVCDVSQGDGQDHYGGTRTCLERAICEACGAAYGDQPEGHDWSEWQYENETQHRRVCTDCGAEEMGDHRGGEANCISQKECTECEHTYGGYGEHNFKVESDQAVPGEETTCLGDGTYYLLCDVCGSWDAEHTYVKRAPGHDGDGEPIPSEDGITHYETCTVCNLPCNSAKHDSENPATCQERKKCKACEVYYGELGDHDPVEEAKPEFLRTAQDCENDATYWKSCSVCGEKLDEYFTTKGTKLGHTGGTATCTEKAVCERCGEPYGELEPHDEQPVHDTQYHWTECAVCGTVLSEKVEHSYKDACDASCDGVNCGYERTPPHQWGDKPVSTNAEDVHWIACELCATKQEGSESPCGGGMATCMERPVCVICDTKYGTTAPHGYSLQLEVEEACKKAPACEEEGIYYLSCATCEKPSMDDAYTFTVPALEHDYSEEYTKCADDPESHHRVCQRVFQGVSCDGATDEEKCFGGQATCDEKPICAKCGGEYGTSLGCDFSIEDVSDEKKVPGQTLGCEGNYQYYKTCSRCGEISNNEEDTFYAQTGKHQYPEEYSRKDDDNQFHYRYCKACGDLGDFGVDKQPHDYGDYVITEPTCAKEGTKVRTCKVCEYADSDPIPSLPHEYEEGYSIITEGPMRSETSGEVIYKHMVVRRCVNYDPLGCNGYLKLSEFIEHAHQDVETRNEVPATCTETGLSPEVYCAVEGCGVILTEQEPIPALGHDYVDYECTRCGDVDVDGSHWLTYQLSEDGTYYILTGRGECTDEQIVVPPSYKGLPVAQVSDNAFYEDTFGEGLSLTSITFPASIQRIGAYAFGGCAQLETVTFQDDAALTELDDYAFSGTALASVRIPAGVTRIGYAVFAGCAKLAKITVDEANTVYCAADNVIYSKDMTTVVCYPGGKTDAELALASGVTRIEDFAIRGAVYLTKAELPGGVTYVGDGAFQGCTSLQELSAPVTVTNIGSFALGGCGQLAYIYYEGSEAQWNQIAFGEEWDATGTDYELIFLGEPQESQGLEYTLSSDGTYYIVSGIGTCTDTEIIIPGTYEGLPVKEIGERAFEYHGGLTSITIPESVQIIGKGAFSSCSSLTGIWAAENSLYFSSDAHGVLFNKAQTCLIQAPGQLSGSYQIPATVTEIGAYAFSGCSSLTSITIPESVTSIGEFAFRGCSRLTEITIPDGITSISSSVFEGCSSLTAIEIPDSVTSIGSGAFYDCSSLTAIKIPDGVSSIGSAALCGCRALTSITIPERVTSIDNYAFYMCDRLVSVTIGGSVTSIGEYAFYGCSSLTEITIPEAVTSIGNSAFVCCSSLTSVTIPENVTSIGMQTFSGCSSLTAIYIPNGVISIGGSAFYGCSSLTEITIPEGVTSIGDYAFIGCSGLKSINISENVTVIGTCAFQNCTALEEIHYNAADVADLTEGNKAFYQAGKDGDGIKLIIGAKVERIPAYLFNPADDSSYAPNLISVEFEEGSVCAEIGAYAFACCTTLETITYPSTTAEWNAIAKETNWDYNCIYTLICLGDPQPSEGLAYTLSTDGTYYIVSGVSTCTDTEIIIPGTYEDLPVKEIGESAFENCKTITSVVLPDSITTLGDFAFRYCSAMTSIDLPEGLTSMGSYALGNCTGLTSLELPESLTSITQCAFYGCSGLQSITIPDTVTSIDTAAFQGCSSLKSLTIPENVTYIGENAFYGCTGLEEIHYNAIEIENLSSGNYTFANAGRSGEGIKLTIGAKVERIPAYLFKPYPYAYGDYVPNIVIVEFEENSVCTSIGQDAFGLCRMLTDISFPDSLTTIEHAAFSSCSGLTSITLPKNLTILSSSVFQYCTGLNAITIPDGVEKIDSSTFHGCTKLTSVTMPDSVTEIISYAFRGCTSLTNITLPVSLNRIANGVFWECTALETIYYAGTTAQWEAVTKDSTWDQDCAYTLVCLGDA